VSDDVIAIRGAREHNLQAIDLDLPRGKLIVFCGLSGSGKSSLAFDTLHAEGQRRYLEALAARVRPGARLRRPDVDAIAGLPPTIALDQRGGAAAGRSTVGSLIDALVVLRVLFARAGTQHCPTCDAVIRPRTHDEIAGILLQNPGDRVSLEAPVRGAVATVLEEVQRAGFSRVRVGGEVVRVEDVDVRTAEGTLRIVVDRLRVETERRDRLYDAIRTTAKAGRGVVIAVRDAGEQVFADRPLCVNCDRTLPPLEPELLSWNSSGACPRCAGRGETDGVRCPDCEGTRLSPEARAIRFAGRSFPEVLASSADELAAAVREWPRTLVAATPLDDLAARLDTIRALGLGHLALGRSAGTVSAGEAQRLRLARQVGAGLSGVLYVLDEPAAGLGDDAVSGVIALIRGLRDRGNTVIVVDHHPDVIAAADLVVEFGPGPGREGGRIVFAGSYAELIAGNTATARWLSGRDALPEPGGHVGAPIGLRRVRSRAVTLDLDVPTGGLVAIVGPSGSGKTALLEAVRGELRARIDGDKAGRPTTGQITGIEPIIRVIDVDRAPLSRSGRSNPATYSGLWDVLRELLAATAEARVRGLDASFFSLAAKGGRCEACQGNGSRKVDLGPLPEVWVPCEVCHGRRFTADVLEVTWKGLSADRILELSVDAAHPVLAGHPRLDGILRTLSSVGLGYVQLGQPAWALSGGEAQRLRLARELVRATRTTGAGTLFLLDDPSVGLHPADVAVLLGVLRKLVDEGATVWMATADAALAKAADARVVLG
jgi:excinuclease ABC subunit A